VQLREDALHLGAGEDGRQAAPGLGAYELIEPGQVHAEHVAVEEQQSGQGLVLGRCGDAAFDGEVVEESGELGPCPGRRGVAGPGSRRRRAGRENPRANETPGEEPPAE
jgi:hypothetical protein